MKFCFFLFFAISVFTAHCAISSQLLSAMAEQAQKIATTMPAGYTSLVRNIEATGFDGADTCAAADFETLMSKYKFNEQIIDQFKMVTFSESVEFQAFHVSINNNYADVQEFIGAGTNQNGVIKIAFLQVYSQGSPIPQEETYRCCHSCWLFATCCNNCQRQVSLTAGQMNIVTEALRATAYSKFNKFITNPPSSFGNYTLELNQYQDKTEWEILMDSYSSCSVLSNDQCTKDFLVTQYDCKKVNIDDQMKCIVDNIRFDGIEESCYLCLCGSFYQNEKYPQSNAECEDRYWKNLKLF